MKRNKPIARRFPFEEQRSRQVDDGDDELDTFYTSVDGAHRQSRHHHDHSNRHRATSDSDYDNEVVASRGFYTPQDRMTTRALHRRVPTSHVSVGEALADCSVLSTPTPVVRRATQAPAPAHTRGPRGPSDHVQLQHRRPQRAARRGPRRPSPSGIVSSFYDEPSILADPHVTMASVLQPSPTRHIPSHLSSSPPLSWGPSRTIGSPASRCVGAPQCWVGLHHYPHRRRLAAGEVHDTSDVGTDLDLDDDDDDGDEEACDEGEEEEWAWEKQELWRRQRAREEAEDAACVARRVHGLDRNFKDVDTSRHGSRSHRAGAQKSRPPTSLKVHQQPAAVHIPPRTATEAMLSDGAIPRASVHAAMSAQSSSSSSSSSASMAGVVVTPSRQVAQTQTEPAPSVTVDVPSHEPMHDERRERTDAAVAAVVEDAVGQALSPVDPRVDTSALVCETIEAQEAMLAYLRGKIRRIGKAHKTLRREQEVQQEAQQRVQPSLVAEEAPAEEDVPSRPEQNVVLPSAEASSPSHASVPDVHAPPPHALEASRVLRGPAAVDGTALSDLIALYHLLTSTTHTVVPAVNTPVEATTPSTTTPRPVPATSSSASFLVETHAQPNNAERIADAVESDSVQTHSTRTPRRQKKDTNASDDDAGHRPSRHYTTTETVTGTVLASLVSRYLSAAHTSLPKEASSHDHSHRPTTWSAYDDDEEEGAFTSSASSSSSSSLPVQVERVVARYVDRPLHRAARPAAVPVAHHRSLFARPVVPPPAHVSPVRASPHRPHHQPPPNPSTAEGRDSHKSTHKMGNKAKKTQASPTQMSRLEAVRVLLGKDATSSTTPSASFSVSSPSRQDPSHAEMTTTAPNHTSAVREPGSKALAPSSRFRVRADPAPVGHAAPSPHHQEQQQQQQLTSHDQRSDELDALLDEDAPRTWTFRGQSVDLAAVAARAVRAAAAAVGRARSAPGPATAAAAAAAATTTTSDDKNKMKATLTKASLSRPAAPVHRVASSLTSQNVPASSMSPDRSPLRTPTSSNSLRFSPLLDEAYLSADAQALEEAAREAPVEHVQPHNGEVPALSPSSSSSSSLSSAPATPDALPPRVLAIPREIGVGTDDNVFVATPARGGRQEETKEQKETTPVSRGAAFREAMAGPSASSARTSGIFLLGRSFACTTGSATPAFVHLPDGRIMRLARRTQQTQTRYTSDYPPLSPDMFVLAHAPPRPTKTATPPSAPVPSSPAADPSLAGSTFVGASTPTVQRTSVIELHTESGYDPVVVARLRRYCRTLESSRQTLLKEVQEEASTVGSQPVGRSAMGASFASSTGESRRRESTRPRTYFRQPYADPEVDATLHNDDEEEDAHESEAGGIGNGASDTFLHRVESHTGKMPGRSQPSMPSFSILSHHTGPSERATRDPALQAALGTKIVLNEDGHGGVTKHVVVEADGAPAATTTTTDKTVDGARHTHGQERRPPPRAASVRPPPPPTPPLRPARADLFSAASSITSNAAPSAVFQPLAGDVRGARAGVGAGGHVPPRYRPAEPARPATRGQKPAPDITSASPPASLASPVLSDISGSRDGTLPTTAARAYAAHTPQRASRYRTRGSPAEATLASLSTPSNSPNRSREEARWLWSARRERLKESQSHTTTNNNNNTNKEATPGSPGGESSPLPRAPAEATGPSMSWLASASPSSVRPASLSSVRLSPDSTSWHSPTESPLRQRQPPPRTQSPTSETNLGEASRARFRVPSSTSATAPAGTDLSITTTARARFTPRRTSSPTLAQAHAQTTQPPFEETAPQRARHTTLTSPPRDDRSSSEPDVATEFFGDVAAHAETDAIDTSADAFDDSVIAGTADELTADELTARATRAAKETIDIEEEAEESLCSSSSAVYAARARTRAELAQDVMPPSPLWNRPPPLDVSADDNNEDAGGGGGVGNKDGRAGAHPTITTVSPPPPLHPSTYRASAAGAETHVSHHPSHESPQAHSRRSSASDAHRDTHLSRRSSGFGDDASGLVRSPFLWSSSTPAEVASHTPRSSFLVDVAAATEEKGGAGASVHDDSVSRLVSPSPDQDEDALRNTDRVFDGHAVDACTSQEEVDEVQQEEGVHGGGGGGRDRSPETVEASSYGSPPRHWPYSADTTAPLRESSRESTQARTHALADDAFEEEEGDDYDIAMDVPVRFMDTSTNARAAPKPSSSRPSSRTRQSSASTGASPNSALNNLSFHSAQSEDASTFSS